MDTLLALQIRHTPVDAGNLRELRYRVYCLGLVHQKLIQSGDLETINLGEFLRDLAQALITYHATSKGDLTLDVTVEPVDATIKIDVAIPLGLLVTELVSNAYRHAFLPDQHGIIDVSLTITGGGRAYLIVADKGAAVLDTSSPSASAIGQQIIAALVDQLDGEMTMDENHGRQVVVTFPCPGELPC